MSFWGHWNGKFPFIPPSALPGVAVHVSWPGCCRLAAGTTTAPQHLPGCTQQLPTNPGAWSVSGLRGAALLGAELLQFLGARTVQGSITAMCGCQRALPPDGCHGQAWKGHLWGSHLACGRARPPPASLLTPHPWGSSGAERELGQSIPPPELTDAELSLHGRPVPEELIKPVPEPLTAVFASILLLTVPSRRAKCSCLKW